MARVLAVAFLALVAAACASTAVSPDASEGEGPGMPVACFGLEQPDCTRALEFAAGGRARGDEVVYVEVGPFGCPNDAGCPNTLAFRPSGQVVFQQANGELVVISVTAAGDGTAATSPIDYLGVAVAPTSTGGQLAAGPIPFSLGHCGLGSGIDVDGSWWDPVGFVDVDHSDAINAADGTFTPHDRNHATFTTNGGFAVSLVRRLGEKPLPPCM